MPVSESVVNRLGFGILAVSLWGLGLGAISGGGFYNVFYGRYFDFGQHHTVLGVVLLVLGSWSACQVFRRSAPKR